MAYRSKRVYRREVFVDMGISLNKLIDESGMTFAILDDTALAAQFDEVPDPIVVPPPDAPEAISPPETEDS